MDFYIFLSKLLILWFFFFRQGTGILRIYTCWTSRLQISFSLQCCHSGQLISLWIRGENVLLIDYSIFKDKSIYRQGMIYQVGHCPRDSRVSGGQLNLNCRVACQRISSFQMWRPWFNHCKPITVYIHIEYWIMQTFLSIWEPTDWRRVSCPVFEPRFIFQLDR